MSLENAFSAIGKLCEDLEAIKTAPSLKYLEGVDLSKTSPLHERDKTFMRNLIAKAKKDPSVLSRVVRMREKLNNYKQSYSSREFRNAKKLTRKEIRELIQELECRGFYHTDLDISGYTFNNLSLRGSVIGGDLIMSYREGVYDEYKNSRPVKIKGNFDQAGIVVQGSIHQNDIVVVGNFLQENLTCRDLQQRRVVVCGGMYQSGCLVEGWVKQDDIFIKGHNIQERTRAGGGITQVQATIGGNNHQSASTLGTRFYAGEGRDFVFSCTEKSYEFDSNMPMSVSVPVLDQQGMRVGKHNFQEKMRIYGSISQGGTEIQGHNNQDGLECWRLYQSGMYVRGDNHQSHLRTFPAVYLGHISNIRSSREALYGFAAKLSEKHFLSSGIVQHGMKVWGGNTQKDIVTNRVNQEKFFALGSKAEITETEKFTIYPVGRDDPIFIVFPQDKGELPQWVNERVTLAAAESERKQDGEVQA